jgi:hypothetical protein
MRRSRPMLAAFGVLASALAATATPARADAGPVARLAATCEGCDGDVRRPADESGARYRGFVDRFDGEPAREGSQGAGWRAIFEEKAAGRVRYRVCLRHLGNGERRCWDRRTNRRGVSRVFVALFVNDRGGPGRWRARWFVDGERVATWRFRVRPEFG